MSNRGRAGAHQHQGCPSSSGGNAAESRKTLPTDANTTPTTTPQRLGGASIQQQVGGDKSAMWGAPCEGGGSDTTATSAAEDAARGGGGAAPTRGASWRGADKVESESRVGKKRTRVEGRGSSAAQRAAANEACKGITLEALQAQYYRPLSDVAKDLGVSVARLLKKCREFGILRWPYRHVRSVQESIEQLEKDREAATDEVATDELELRLKLLRRRGELVVHFASCGLESEMRKGIFLADPRDVDTMLNNAHEVHGGRKMPPPGWDSLGRFPDAAVREHFLQQMRAHMVGGGAMLSPPDSPHVATNVHDDSGSSLEDSSRDVLHHHHQQQKLQYQYQHLQLGYRGVAPHHSRPEGQWQQQPPPPQSHAYPRQGSHHYQQPAWQGRQMYPRGGAPDPVAHSAPYWPGLQGAAEMPEVMGVGAGAGMGGGGVGKSLEASELGRLRSSPGHVDVPSSVSVPHAGVYAPASAASWQAGPQTGSATGPLGHQEEGGRNSSLSPLLRPRFSGPPGSGGVAGYRVGGGGRDPQMPMNTWGGGNLGPASESSAAAPGGGINHGGALRDEWRPSERLTPQTPPTPSHLGGPRRPWGSGDLVNPAGRGGLPQSGGAGALPSIFNRNGRGRRGQTWRGPGPCRLQWVRDRWVRRVG
ncbi:unnamed protein product [Ascophyllum nodosum]